MRKNYFGKLVKYMKDVYHLERGLTKLSDGSSTSASTTVKPLILLES